MKGSIGGPMIMKFIAKESKAVIIPLAKEGDMCPYCTSGFLTLKCGKYGHFLGCSDYPKCKIIVKWFKEDSLGAINEDDEDSVGNSRSEDFIQRMESDFINEEEKYNEKNDFEKLTSEMENLIFKQVPLVKNNLISLKNRELMEDSSLQEEIDNQEQRLNILRGNYKRLLEELILLDDNKAKLITKNIIRAKRKLDNNLSN